MSSAKIGERDGVGMSQGHASGQQASDRDLWLAVRDEIDAVKAAASVTTPNATDLATAVTLVNSLKTALNNIAALTDKFSK